MDFNGFWFWYLLKPFDFVWYRVKKWKKLNFFDNFNDDFIEAYNSLSMILNSNYTFNYNFKFMIRVVNNQLNLTVLIKQRWNHEAYTNQKMKKHIRGIWY